jgi:hypothetical protein
MDPPLGRNPRRAAHAGGRARLSSSRRHRLSRCRKRRFGRIGGSSHLRRAWRSACSRRSACWPICSRFSAKLGLSL